MIDNYITILFYFFIAIAKYYLNIFQILYNIIIS